MRVSVLVFGLLLLASAAQAVDRKDTLLVVLDVNGQQSAHHQQTAHDSCAKFVAAFRQSTTPITLTFEAPPKVTGRVVDAACIRPNGSIERQ